MAALFKSDLHEAQQRRQSGDRGHDLIQVLTNVLANILFGSQFFLLQRTNMIQRSVRKEQGQTEEIVLGDVNSGAGCNREAAFGITWGLLKAGIENTMMAEGKAGDCHGEVSDGAVQEDDTAQTSHKVLRLKGGGKEESSSGDEEQKMMPPPAKKLKRRKRVYTGERDQPLIGSCFEKSCQRPAPMDPPRQQDLEFGNMTADVLESEDGTEIFSPCLDNYRRTEAQVEAVRAAGEDQRKVGGGVYENKGGTQQFLTIQKGWTTKDIGLKLITAEEGQIKTKLNCFAMMEYEYFKFSKSTPGHRIRQKQPQETHTGYVWNGFGGDLVPAEGMCRVYAYCERAGERDLHFSELGCERLSEAPGASQQMCSNRDCGVVKWHLSQKEFQYDNNGQWEEIQQNDFALVMFKTGKEELVWTEQPTVGQSTRSRWVRLENSEQFDGVQVDNGSKQRITNFLNQHRLPPFVFPVPRYEPLVQRWRDQEVLRRQAASSER